MNFKLYKDRNDWLSSKGAHVVSGGRDEAKRQAEAMGFRYIECQNGKTFYSSPVNGKPEWFAA